MKTFREFITEAERRAPRNPGESLQDYIKRVKGISNHPDAKIADTPGAADPRTPQGKSTNVSGQDVRSGSQTRTQTPPRQPSGTSTQTPPRSTQTRTQTPPRGAQASSGSTPPPRNTQASSAPPRSSSSGLSTSPRSSSSASTSTVKPRGGFRNAIGRQLGVAAIDATADTAIDRIKDTKKRENIRTTKDAITTGASLYANPIASLALGSAGPSSSAQPGIRDFGAYRIHKRIGTEDPQAGFDRFLATGRNKKGFTYNDPNAEKITAYRRDRVGSKNPEDKPVRVGAARLGGQIVPARWGAVAGEKKVGTPEQQASTRGVQQSRQIAARSGAYGTRQGSGLSGIGGQTTTSRDTKGNTFMSTGAGSQRKTVQLAKTQLVRDPRTGKQVVGDLAFKGGKATYLARPSISSRDGNLFSRLSRATGIGGQRERDAAAAKQEYRTALKNTQTYQKKLGITPQAATKQKLPGRGVGPAKVGPKKVGPKLVGPKIVGPKKK